MSRTTLRIKPSTKILNNKRLFESLLRSLRNYKVLPATTFPYINTARLMVSNLTKNFECQGHILYIAL